MNIGWHLQDSNMKRAYPFIRREACATAGYSVEDVAFRWQLVVLLTKTFTHRLRRLGALMPPLFVEVDHADLDVVDQKRERMNEEEPPASRSPSTRRAAPRRRAGISSRKGTDESLPARAAVRESP